MKTSLSLALLLLATPALAQGQAAPAVPIDVQITAAISPLPAEFREAATVLGYPAAGAPLSVLREGSGFVCIADDATEEPRFHVACYHESLEPFMARGRELRAQGLTAAQTDEVREEEAVAGTLPMPKFPAALYSYTGVADNFDAETGTVTGARALYVLYMPFATEATTGLPTRPQQDHPWLMSAGTAKAHIMFSPSM
jgi:hypothetical protein